MATLEDIARELQVSKSTVSKALSGAKDVSRSMRQQVLEKAVELGYSRFPRGTGNLKIVVFITNMEYSKPEDFGYDLIVGFRKAAEPAGYQVDVCCLDLELQNEERYDAYMIRNGYCGAFFLGMAPADPWLREFENCKTPTVVYDNHIAGNPNVTHVGVDNAEAMKLVVQHLIALGHRRIGYLSGIHTSYVYQERYRGFCRTMEDNGLPVDPELYGDAFHVSECLALHMPRLLKANCTAIVCSHDMLAQGVMVHCRELGLRIPEDISIVGFDDIPLCRYTVPPLSTIRQNRVDLGKSAFSALSSQLNKVPIGTLLLHAELIERSSCAPAAIQKTSA